MFISSSRGLTALAALALALTAACAPADSDGGSGSDSTADAAKAATSLSDCKPADLPLLTSGTFTIATDDPAFEPWFVDNDPTNGKGFEGAVAYAVADKLGFAKDDVTWVKAGFNQAVQAGTKSFDVDINQFSITADRAKAVDFSSPYYSAAQAIITLKDSSFAGATTLADLKDAKLGAQVATTSLEAIKQIAPSSDPLVYDDTTKAAQALQNGQVDAVVADLPSAYYLTSAELDGATIVGQFQPTTGESEKFGLLLAKDSALTPCVSLAVDALADDGTLAALEKEWLTQATDVPELK
ncbi:MULTISPECIES: ABC transporter substrate-binding protein [Aeromicrobium]|uniref:ABC transporter substrate-binding protein n=1 Tax=Aeromicrobium TaxID=2040 RepID=UPI0006F5DD85|nr:MULTISPECIES: ABC transporter substrate-binding protein [Aeromicrobium]KQX74091.1 ABC transporter substrate-binding protein [Aeromicrobium sp. Root472D3]MCL8251670.1 ABC transporter substrate-binding protein [Aeromicrobium fastidiosum]